MWGNEWEPEEAAKPTTRALSRRRREAEEERNAEEAAKPTTRHSFPSELNLFSRSTCGLTNESERGKAAQSGARLSGSLAYRFSEINLPGRRVHCRAAQPAGTAKPGSAQKAHLLRSP